MPVAGISVGVLMNWSGRPDTAIEHVQASLRLNPRHRVGAAAHIIGLAHFFALRFDEAVPKLLFAIQQDPTYAPSHRALAASYAHMGRVDDAEDAVKRLRGIAPVMPSYATPFRNPEHRELYLSGLRL